MQKKKMPKTLWFIIVALIIIAFRVITTETVPKQEVATTTYSELIQMINTGTITSVDLNESSSVIATAITADGSYYETTIPDKEIFLQFIQQKIVEGQNLDITINESVSNTSLAGRTLNLIVWAYVILMVVMIVYQVKKLNLKKLLIFSKILTNILNLVQRYLKVCCFQEALEQVKHFWQRQ